MSLVLPVPVSPAVEALSVSRFDKRTHALFGPYLGQQNLELGCGRNPHPGFTTLDVSPKVGADIVHDLEQTPLPFDPDTWDCILASHVFEHISRFVPLVRELHRILKPGGALISVTPYGTSNDAWENPFHVRAFSELTWQYFSEALYAQDGHAGSSDFGIDFTLEVVETMLVPYPLFRQEPREKLDWMIRHWRNIVQELHVVLRKPLVKE